MLQTTVSVIEIEGGELAVLLDTDRFRPGDYATELELRYCMAIHAAMHTLIDQPGTAQILDGCKDGAALSKDFNVCRAAATIGAEG